MIHEVIMYRIDCDNCNEQFITEEGWSCMEDIEGLEELMKNDDEEDWHITGDKTKLYYCPKCHFFNDLDNLEIRTERKPKKQQNEQH